MYKLTKARRLSIYKKMLKQIQSTLIVEVMVPNSLEQKIHFINFCWIIDLVEPSTMIWELPELMAKKPQHGWPVNICYWYHPHDRVRVKILEDIISSMKVSLLDRLLRRK